MTKEYRSGSHIVIGLRLADGSTKRVSFMQLTGGGSVFRTDDEEVQNALEKHSFFNRSFVLAKTITGGPKPQTAPAPVKTEPSVKEMEFACLDDAKEYIVEKYGMSRTKLRSEKAIMEAGLSNGIKITIKD